MKFRQKTEQVGRWNIYETRYFRGQSKNKNGVKRLCFSIICILLEVIFIITIVTRLNEYAEIINLFTRILSGILVLGLYASDKTSSMKMPWVILILIFPIMGVGLYLLIGLNGGTHKCVSDMQKLIANCYQCFRTVRSV